MIPEQFVKACYIEKQNFLKEYLSENSKTDVAQLINALNLNDQQTEIMKKVLDGSFTDIFYTILLGLDGCAAIGDMVQQQFTILDKNNNQVCGEQQLGEIQAFAYKYFHESNP